MGNIIAQRDIEKVFPADEYSAVGHRRHRRPGGGDGQAVPAGAGALREGRGAQLSLEGKANRLSTMIRGNLGMALQGLAVVPLFAGYDTDREKGRIFSYDVTGGRSEERGFAATGSGSVFARGAMKKLYRAGSHRGAGHDPGRPGAVRRRGRRLGDRWPGRGPPDLPDRHRDHRRGLPQADRRRSPPRSPGPSTSGGWSSRTARGPRCSEGPALRR